MNTLGDTSIGVISSWLHGLTARQNAISNNIANIDTPGYQRQEARFETALQQQIGGGSTQLKTTDARHIAVGGRLSGQLGVDPAQLLTSSRMDQNNVSIDQEMTSLADTQMRFQAASEALTTKLSILKQVIAG